MLHLLLRFMQLVRYAQAGLVLHSRQFVVIQNRNGTP